MKEKSPDTATDVSNDTPLDPEKTHNGLGTGPLIITGVLIGIVVALYIYFFFCVSKKNDEPEDENEKDELLNDDEE